MYRQVPTSEMAQRSAGPGGQVQLPLPTVESHWKNVFMRYDEDKDGKIPINDFVRALTSSSFNKDVPKLAVERIVRRADENRDNYITFQEFLDMVETKEGQYLVRGWMHSYVHHTVPRRGVKRDRIDGEYEDEYSCNPPAIAMVIVSLIELATFFYDISVTGQETVSGPTATVLIYDPHRRKEAWRYMSYMFVHLGYVHLTVNILVQVLLGIPLEMVHGWWRVLTVYVSGVVAGSLITSVSDPSVYLAGASGGVYALITAHLATLIMNWSEMEFAVWQLLVFLVLCGTDVGSSVYDRYIRKVDTKVGYAAHFGGAVAGLLVGLYILRNLEVHRWEKKLWWSALIIYILFIGTAIVWNISFPDYFPIQYV